MPAKRRHYSKDLKQRVVHQSKVLGYSTAQIAQNLDMSLHVVQNVLRLYDEIGEVVWDPKTFGKQGRRMIMDTGVIEFMLTLLDSTPDIYLDEIAEQIMEQHDINVSISTISRTLKALGVTSKKLSCMAAERCEDTRLDFMMKIGNEDPSRLVFTDESAVNVLTTYRIMGWSYKGTQAHVSSYFQRGDRYSVLLALTLDGILYAQIVPGSFNGS